MEDIVIRRDNFKDVRKQYKIKLKELASMCNLSPQTISNFENSTGLYSSINARDYNSSRMINTLSKMIEDRKEKIMAEKESKSAMLKTKQIKSTSDTSHKPTIIRRDTFTENLKKYLSSNKITIVEFCKMCGVAHSVFSPGYIKKNPFLSIKHLNRIKDATGWSEDQIKSGSFAEEVSPMTWVATEKSKAAMAAMMSKENRESRIFETNKSDKASVEDNSSIKDKVVEAVEVIKLDPSVQMNVKYVFQNGNYYKEYDIVKHVSEVVSKEDFMKALEG